MFLRAFLFSVIAVILLLCSFAGQEFMPALNWAQGSKFILPVTVFFGLAVIVSYPVMLILAFIMGFLWDARHLAFTVSGGDSVQGSVDLAFGYSILLFGLTGSLMQGIRPLLGRGRFELPVLMMGLVTGVWLLAEYLFLVFRRGQPEFPDTLWIKVGSTALLALLISPIVLFALHTIARWTGYEVRYEGLSRRET